jgi:hypothetical protein
MTTKAANINIGQTIPIAFITNWLSKQDYANV